MTDAKMWHGQRCQLIVKPVFRKGIKRNALIQLESGEKIVVPWRSVRNIHADHPPYSDTDKDRR